MKKHPSVDQLRALLTYDPQTGALTWKPRAIDPKNWNKRHAGKPAFATNIRGYLCGAVNRVLLRGHRVAWAIHHGHWPQGEIDHVNGDKQDNRLENLRDVTAQENRKNQKMRVGNTSGQTGVCFIPSRRKWRALISHNGQRINLGSFDCRDAAVAARAMAEATYGYHQNHGRKA
jgi:HNH endonuclease/AP2 domain